MQKTARAFLAGVHCSELVLLVVELAGPGAGVGGTAGLLGSFPAGRGPCLDAWRASSQGSPPPFPTWDLRSPKVTTVNVR